MAKGLARVTAKHLDRLMFWLLALGGTGAIFLVTVVPLREEYQTLSGRVERLREQSKHLEDRIAELQTEHLAALHDPFYVELVARTELYLVKPGEEVVRTTKSSSSPLRASMRDTGRGLEPSDRLVETVSVSPGDRWVGFVLGVLSLVAALCLFGQESSQEKNDRISARNAPRRL